MRKYKEFKNEDLDARRSSTPVHVNIPPPVAESSGTQFDNEDLEKGLSTHAPVAIATTHLPPTPSFMCKIHIVGEIFGRRLTYMLLWSLLLIPIVTAFSRIIIMKMVTGHIEYIPLIVEHLVYTFCTGVLTNMVTAHYADFIAKIMYSALSRVQELYAEILPVVVESMIKHLEKNKDAVKNAISLVIKIVMVFLTVFITVLDSLNIAVIIIPIINLANVIVIRRLTKKPEEAKVLPYSEKDCMLKLKVGDGLCPYCQAICKDRCGIIGNLNKSLWTQTLLITVTWVPDIICIWVFAYSESTSSVIISYMYSSWMIRDTITFAFKVMDDEALPARLVEQMLTVYSYLSKNQVSLRNEGVKLTKKITEVHVKDYECPHGKVSFILKPGITILGGLNGSGKSELFRLFLIGMKKAFSVMHSGTMLLLSECSLASIRETILYYTADMILPLSRLHLYQMNPELAAKLGITQIMANRGRPSKGEHALFLVMWIIMVHGHEQGIVILDEVTANLDHENRKRVFRVIREYCKGIVIVVDHSVPDDQLDVVLPSPSK